MSEWGRRGSIADDIQLLQHQPSLPQCLLPPPYVTANIGSWTRPNRKWIAPQILVYNLGLSLPIHRHWEVATPSGFRCSTLAPHLHLRTPLVTKQEHSAEWLWRYALLNARAALDPLSMSMGVPIFPSSVLDPDVALKAAGDKGEGAMTRWGELMKSAVAARRWSGEVLGRDTDTDGVGEARSVPGACTEVRRLRGKEYAKNAANATAYARGGGERGRARRDETPRSSRLRTGRTGRTGWVCAPVFIRRGKLTTVLCEDGMRFDGMDWSAKRWNARKQEDERLRERECEREHEREREREHELRHRTEGSDDSAAGPPCTSDTSPVLSTLTLGATPSPLPLAKCAPRKETKEQDIKLSIPVSPVLNPPRLLCHIPTFWRRSRICSSHHALALLCGATRQRNVIQPLDGSNGCTANCLILQ
ncbi:hypothetical protein DFH08DRAFT_805516 [Mycena albidolilacea]|uniref:Uncharacterized protein n=1 Tax=Mycena albidolilacea TaxID=1033008 RepID=A0AAD7A9S3_9AGAR|nr:hypothetical protein DFH08DRAFT_805516 [Mycena albidolilacea]